MNVISYLTKYQQALKLKDKFKLRLNMRLILLFILMFLYMALSHTENMNLNPEADEKYSTVVLGEQHFNPYTY